MKVSCCNNKFYYRWRGARRGACNKKCSQFTAKIHTVYGCREIWKVYKTAKKSNRAPTDISTEESKQSFDKARKHLQRRDRPKLYAILKHLKACIHPILTLFPYFNLPPRTDLHCSFSLTRNSLSFAR